MNKLRLKRLGLNLMGALLGAALLTTVAEIQHPVAPSAWITEWDTLAMACMLIAGAGAGVLLTANGLLESARRELGPISRGYAAPSSVPLGVILIILSVVCFYLSAIIYFVITSVQSNKSQSVLRAFGVSLGITAVFSLVAHIGTMYILLFGGNFVFPAFLGGWLITDIRRKV